MIGQDGETSGGFQQQIGGGCQYCSIGYPHNCQFQQTYPNYPQQPLFHWPQGSLGQQFFGQRGWICPACSHGISPFVTVCPCAGTTSFTVTNNTGTTTISTPVPVEGTLTINEENK